MTDLHGVWEPAGSPVSGPPPLPAPPTQVDGSGFVPYLGPVPAPSKPFGTAFTVLAAVVAVVSAAQAVQYWLRRNLWLTDIPAGTTVASVEQLNANGRLVYQLHTVRQPLVLLAALAGVLWWVRRRTPRLPAQRDPSFVERPLLRSLPAWLWVLPPLLLVLGGALHMAANDGLSEPTYQFADIVQLNQHKAELNTLAGLGSLARAGAWALFALWPVYAGRSLRARLDRSQPHRTLTPF